MRAASAVELIRLCRRWSFWALPEQLPPSGAWRTWVFLGGRGAGKTRAGAEWVRSEVEQGRLRRIALVGPTFADVREVMIDGPSGLVSRGARVRGPRYEASRRRLVWPNGAVAYAFSAEDPESLRGPQFDGAWLDELLSSGSVVLAREVVSPATVVTAVEEASLLPGGPHTAFEVRIAQVSAAYGPGSARHAVIHT